MGCAIRSVAWLSVILFVSPVTVATAAGPDLRLVDATVAQDRAAVRMLLKEGVDVNVARADGATALLYAAHWNDLETVELLLQAGAGVNSGDDHGVTPLARACENRNLRMVVKLLSVGADPNIAQTSGLTPLMIAAKTGHVEVLKTLLAHGAVSAATTKTKNTALMWAVAGGHLDNVRALIDARADVHVSTAKGWTPLMMAARRGDIGAAKVLIAAGVSVNDTAPEGTHVLPFSIVMGQAEFAQFLLEQGADPNGAMAGIRALHAAVASVRPWLGEWRQKQGAAARGRELTPTQRSALVAALLARGADVNARIENSGVFESYLAYPRRGAFDAYTCGVGDLRGATPLWLAAHAANGSAGTRPALDGDAADERESTEPGAANIHVRFLKMLLSAGADYRITTADGTTVLMVAAGLGRCTDATTNNHLQQRGERSASGEAAVRLLIDAGADVHATNEADFTALHGAAFRGSNEVVQILVDHGANMDARDFRGRTPYRLAEGSKQSFYFQEYPETAEFIRKLGANTALSLPGVVQERLRDGGSNNQQRK